jgi:hypothetical protein
MSGSDTSRGLRALARLKETELYTDAYGVPAYLGRPEEPPEVTGLEPTEHRHFVGAGRLYGFATLAEATAFARGFAAGADAGPGLAFCCARRNDPVSTLVGEIPGGGHAALVYSQGGRGLTHYEVVSFADDETKAGEN